MTDDKRYSPFPDIEAMVGAALRAEGVCGRRVYSSIPANPTYPLVTVARLGGVPPDRRRLDRARIQVDVYGNNKAEARDAAELARRVVLEMEGETFASFNGFVSDVEDELGLTFLPDQDTKKDRYLFAVGVFAHHSAAE